MEESLVGELIEELTVLIVRIVAVIISFVGAAVVVFCNSLIESNIKINDLLISVDGNLDSISCLVVLLDLVEFLHGLNELALNADNYIIDLDACLFSGASGVDLLDKEALGDVVILSVNI